METHTIKQTTYAHENSTIEPTGVAYLVLGNEIFFSGLEMGFEEAGICTIQGVEDVVVAICQAEGIRQEECLFYDIQTLRQYPDNSSNPNWYCVDQIAFESEGTEWYCVASSEPATIHHKEKITPNVAVAIEAFQQYIQYTVPEIEPSVREKLHKERIALYEERAAKSLRDARAYLLKKNNLTEETAAAYSTEFIRTCNTYHIEQSLWSNPRLYAYVNFLVQAKELQLNMHNASNSHSGYWISPSDDEVYEDKAAMRKAGMEENDNQFFFRPANALSAQNTYGIAEVLMRCVAAMLDDGLSGNKTHKHYILGKANAALGAYGLSVTEESDL